MAGNTVGNLNMAVTSIINELVVLKSNITDSYNKLATRSSSVGVGSEDINMKKQINDFNEQAATDDQQFVEEEARLQGYGGKTRKQSLQEFVLLFFFVAFGILTVALVLMTNYTSGSTQAWKTFGLMLFILLIITGIILRYA
jgi:hypothetical protein